MGSPRRSAVKNYARPYQDATVVDQFRTAVAGRPIAAFFRLTVGWTWGSDLLLYVIVEPSPSITIPPLTVVRTWGPIFCRSGRPGRP